MENGHLLKAGAGKAAVGITEEMLPQDGFSSIHDDLSVRALILESDVRIAILSVEITSLFPHTKEQMISLACEHAKVDAAHLWLTLTHSFAGPHLWKSPDPGKEDAPGPGHKAREADEIARCERLTESYYRAVKEAVDQAVQNLSDAVIGSGSGESHVNASRNIETPEGFWIGTDDEKPCDRKIRLVRVDKADGGTIAVLFSYGIRSCVMMDVKGEHGGKVVSSDLCGFASKYVEEELGDGAVALFLCGAAADQEPLLKAVYEETDVKGARRTVDFREAADSLLKAQGTRLGTQVLRATGRIGTLHDAGNISVAERAFTVKTKTMNRNLRELKPVRHMDFEENGERNITIYGIRLDKINLIGVEPELDGQTVSAICGFAEPELTITAIQVNGGDKCMPGMDAYENFYYQAQNSPYMPGSAEKLTAEAKELLRDLGAHIEG